MIKAIALDDEPPALQIISSFCTKTDEIDLVKTFTRTEEAAAFLSDQSVDLLFLDINMPSISGLEFSKAVDPKLMVIFITAYSEYAIEGFNLNAVDYLLKPFTVQRFLQAVDKAKIHHQFLQQQLNRRPDHITVKVEYSLVRIELNDILFVEGLDDYLKIHLQHQKPVITRLTMKALIEKLPPSDFLRVHRSFTIPLKRIEAVRNKMISIAGQEIPIGSSYETAFFDSFRP